MYFSDLISRLAYSVVADLAIGEELLEPAGLTENARLRVVNHTNSALTALHTKFCLIRKSLELKQFAGRFSYPLRQIYAETAISGQAQRFILDASGTAFLGDLLGIEQVFTDQMVPLPLNVRNNILSWHTREFDTLLAPSPVADQRFFVEYRANHPRLSGGAGDSTEIVLPPSLENALLLLVCYNFYSTSNAESAMLRANALIQQYEMECQMMSSTNLTNESEVGAAEELFIARGWN